jgi:hypothetical protein
MVVTKNEKKADGSREVEFSHSQRAPGYAPTEGPQKETVIIDAAHADSARLKEVAKAGSGVSFEGSQSGKTQLRDATSVGRLKDLDKELGRE